MKRTELKRKTKLVAKSSLSRKSKLVTKVRLSTSQSRRLEKMARAKERREAARALEGHQAVPKPMREVDEDYLEWIRHQPCVVSGWRGGVGMDRVDPAHTDTVGHGGSDYGALPLTRRHHNEQHRVGFDTFAQRHDLDYDRLIHEHNRRYERQTGRHIRQGGTTP